METKYIEKYKALSINNILEYNPYDNKYRYHNKGFSINDFTENFFVELDEYNKYYEDLKNAISPSNNLEKKFIIS